MSTDFLTVIGDFIIEELKLGYSERLPTADPIYQTMFTSAESVITDPVTKDWKIIESFMTSVAGAFRHGTVGGPPMQAGLSRTNIGLGHGSFPAFADVVQPGLGQYSLQMAKCLGNIAFDLNQFRAQSLSTTVDNYPARVLQQTVKQAVHDDCLSWYLNTSAQIIQINSSGGTTVRDGQFVTVTRAAGVTDNGRIRRILPGMQFDLWKDDMTVCYTQNGWALLDSSINYYEDETSTITLFFQSATDAIAFEAGGSDNVWLVCYDAILDRALDGSDRTGASILPLGYQSWVLDAGAATAQILYGAFGNLDITSHGSYFGSLIVAIGGALDVATLNAKTGNFRTANQFHPTTGLTTQGVLNQLLDDYGEAGTNYTPTLYRDQNEVQQLKLGYAEPGFSYKQGGRAYNIYVSDYINSGELLMLKTDDGNCKKHIPPALGELRGEGPVDLGAGVEWLGKKFTASPWMPVYNNAGGPTEGMQAPYTVIFQRSAKEPRAIRLTGITEQAA